MSFFRIKVCDYCVFLENDKTNPLQFVFFFQSLRGNTCSSQLALESTAPSL